MRRITSTLLMAVISVLSLWANDFSSGPKMKLSAKSPDASSIITEVEGETLNYVATGRYSLYPDDPFGLIDGYGLGMQLCFDADGKTVYMYNLIPSYQGKAWLKGTLENGIISIKSGQMVKESNSYGLPVYVGCAARNESGDGLVLMQDALFRISEDKSRIEQIFPAQESLYVIAYDEEGHVGQLITELVFDRIGDAPMPPESAEVKDYLFYRDENGYDFNLGAIATSGNDVYLRGVSHHLPNRWIKGVLDNGDILIPTRQYVGLSGNYIVNCYCNKNNNPVDNIRLIFDADNNSYSMEEGATLFFGTQEYEPEVYVTYLTLEPFVFDNVQPKAPTELTYDAETNNFSFRSSLLSTDDNELLRELMYFRIYIDGELLEFKTDKYPFLEENITDIPYSKMYWDEENGQMWGGGNAYMPTSIILRESGFNKIGVRQVYKYNGKEVVSELAELNLDGGVTVPSNISIESLSIPATIYPDMENIAVASFINNGEKAITEIEFTLMISDLEPIVKKEEYPYYPMEPGYDNRTEIKFTVSGTENKIVDYKFYISSVNGVATSKEGAINGKLMFVKEGFDRNLVYEAGLGTDQGYAPVGEYGMDYMTSKYADKGFIGICAHAQSSEMAVFGDNGVYQPLASKFWSLPASYLNRGETFVYPNPEELEASYNTNIALKAPAQINAEITFESEDRTEIKLSTESEFLFDREDADYAVGYVVVEDNVGPYVQSNSYAGSSYDYCGFQDKPAEFEMTYNNVARNCSEPLPTESVFTGSISKGKKYNHDFDIDLFDVDDYDNYKVIALLIDNKSGEIMNASVAKRNVTGIANIEEEDSAFTAIGSKNRITIIGDAKVAVYSLDGQRIANDVCNATLNVEPGAYVVTDGCKSVKTLVK